MLSPVYCLMKYVCVAVLFFYKSYAVVWYWIVLWSELMPQFGYSSKFSYELILVVTSLLNDLFINADRLGVW